MSAVAAAPVPCGLAAAALALALGAGAQEIESRAFSNAPIGVNFLLAGYAHTSGGFALMQGDYNFARICPASGRRTSKGFPHFPEFPGISQAILRPQ